MTGAIRTQIRLNAAGIKSPQGEEFSRICPHCEQNVEETAEHISWDCTLCTAIRTKTQTHLSQIILDSPARAGIPTDWADWPKPLRAFGVIGLEQEIILSMKELPRAPSRGPRDLITIDFSELSDGPRNPH